MMINLPVNCNADIFLKRFRRCCRITFLYLIVCISTASLLHAQSSSKALQDSLFNKYALKNKLSQKGDEFNIVQFNSICMELANAIIVRRISSHIAIIRSSDKNPNFTNCIEKSAPASDYWKLSTSIEEEIPFIFKQINTTRLFTVLARDIDTLIYKLQKQKIYFEIVSVFRESQAAVIKCKTKNFFEQFLPEPDLLFADLAQSAATDALVSGYDRSINKINLFEYLFPGVNGHDIVIGIKEKMIDGNDIDLQKRILFSSLAANQQDNHANVTSTLAGGAGNSFYTGKGVATACRFYPSDFINLFPDSSGLLLQKNISVQNHSYGTIIQSFYGAEAAGYDHQTNQNSSLLHIFSSGNRGTESASTGTYANVSGFANITGNFKMAKNIITAAAVDTGGNLAAFGSAGPLYDGRLAPLISALGPNGTSEAAAIVSGAAAVLQQVYKDSSAQILPPASLIKAIMFTTADDIGNTGIDYKSGFGLLNLPGAINCLQQKNYDGSKLAQGEVWTKNLTIPAQAGNLKVTLSWTDTTAQVNNNKALVNDLDLELVELNSGTVYKPWQLSIFPNIDSLNKLPFRNRDSLNTAEQVSVDFPLTGIYQVKVTARQIQTINKQSFHIAFTWDTLNVLRFTNPVHASDIDRQESPFAKIKWKGALADTNSNGNLSISYDNGINWQTIATQIKLNRQSFNWFVPDTAAIVQLRMDATFGTFYSERFAIAPLTKLNIDYRCTDSLRLSWQKHVSAYGYQLYVLGDTAYMKPTVITTDSFLVLKTIEHPEYTYAVQPLLNGGIAAARSLAVDVRNQGVECFYKTLNAENRGDSIQLLLDMSFLNTVNSIEFQKVMANGIPIGSIKQIIPVAGQYQYFCFDNAPVSGVNYYRAKIALSNGQVYTSVIDILHTGKKRIILYPNPVAKGQVINYRVKESFGPSTMQIMDITGRITASFAVQLSGEIKTSNWKPGVYFYRLQNTNNTLQETGKFIIQ